MQIISENCVLSNRKSQTCFINNKKIDLFY